MPADLALPAYDADSPWGTYAPSAVQALSLRACHAMPHPLRFLVKVLRKPMKVGLQHPLDVTIWGLRLRLLPRGNMSERGLLFSPQLLDRAEFALLREHLRPGDAFIDVGANVGVYTYWALRCLGGRGRIVSVEPDPEMRRRLQFNLRNNAGAGASIVDVAPVALSDHEGEAELLVNLEQRGQNTIVGAQAQAVGGTRAVQPVRLDTLVHLLQSRGIERVDALKIDIEAHEAPVLRHFFTHAPEGLWPRLAITEFTAATVDEISALFTDRGYRQLWRTRLNLAYAR